MTSIRKKKKWYKSCAAPQKKGYEKKLKTIRKCSVFHSYLIRHRTFKRTFVTFTICTKSRRKRGKNKSNGGLRLSK